MKKSEFQLKEFVMYEKKRGSDYKYEKIPHIFYEDMNKIIPNEILEYDVFVLRSLLEQRFKGELSEDGNRVGNVELSVAVIHNIPLRRLVNYTSSEGILYTFELVLSPTNFINEPYTPILGIDWGSSEQNGRFASTELVLKAEDNSFGLDNRNFVAFLWITGILTGLEANTDNDLKKQPTVKVAEKLPVISYFRLIKTDSKKDEIKNVSNIVNNILLYRDNIDNELYVEKFISKYPSIEQGNSEQEAKIYIYNLASKDTQFVEKHNDVMISLIEDKIIFKKVNEEIKIENADTALMIYDANQELILSVPYSPTSGKNYPFIIAVYLYRNKNEYEKIFK